MNNPNEIISTISLILLIVLTVAVIWIIWKQNDKDKGENSFQKYIDNLREEIDSSGKIGQLKSELETIKTEKLGWQSEITTLNTKINTKEGEVSQLQREIVDEQRKLSERLSNTSGSLNYGEIAVERTLELSGLKENIDYYSQQPIQDEDGNNVTNANEEELIPDITIRFPDNRYLYIDAKYPDTALKRLKEDKDNKKYSESFKRLITNLANDDYANRGINTPGFCVMFVPGDHYILEAMKHDPEILEFGLERDIVIATPGTLFSIIKTVELSFRREQLNEKANQFYEDSRKLIDITEKFINHFNELELKIRQLHKAYKEALKVLESDDEDNAGLLTQLREIEDKTIGKGLPKTKKIGKNEE
tara:strand:- start:212 stop:1297 length:1086 start_codon:yes stop_codon:yes gene_type:complete